MPGLAQRYNGQHGAHVGHIGGNAYGHNHMNRSAFARKSCSCGIGRCWLRLWCIVLDSRVDTWPLHAVKLASAQANSVTQQQ